MKLSTLLIAGLSLAIFTPHYAAADHHMEKQHSDADNNQFAQRAYAFHTAAQQKNGAVFLTLDNKTASDIKLVKATSDIADRVEIHDMSMKNDVMEMRRIDDLLIPAHKHVELRPHGKHIMLIGLKYQLVSGDNFPLTLHFDNGDHATFKVSVVPPGQGLDNKDDRPKPPPHGFDDAENNQHPDQPPPHMKHH